MRRFEYPTAQDQAEGLAAAVAHALENVVAARGSAVLALSGGRSPIPMFERLRFRPLQWEVITVTLVDERAVPPDHEDSNGRLVREHLLHDAAANAAFVPLIQDAQEAAAPEQAVQRLAGIYRQPDVAVLGLGDDGHTASLFPDAPELADALAARVPGYVVTHPGQAPHARVSLNLAALLATERVFLGFTGAAKAAVFDQAVASPGPALPVGLVAARHKHGFDVLFA